jgi:hypothetical protein
MDMMQRNLMVVVSVLAVLLATGSAGAARSDRKASAKCAPGHSRLIVANARAEVFEAPEPPGPPEGLGVYGCLYGQKLYFLGTLPYGSAEGSGGLKHETLAGQVVAYEESSSGRAESGREEWRVVVRDLRSGKVLRRVPTGMTTPPNPRIVGAGFTSAIVVKSDGAVAWIVEYPIEHGTQYEASCIRHRHC